MDRRAVSLAALALAAGACDSSNTRITPDATVSDAAIAGGDDSVTPSCEPPSGARPNLVLTTVATGFAQPLFVMAAPADASRLFVLEKGGRIRLIRDAAVLPEPFLDISANVQAGGERGLLGLAFHPRYAENGRFFVHYSANANAGGVSAGSAVVAEFTAPAGNPDQADPGSERRLLTLADSQGNHNGGMLDFGPDDGLLYIALGDEGGGGDEHGPIGNGQNLGTWFGKILRIDVDARDAGEYGIPAGNMAGDGTLPEIWSYGWRNPWRFSFDRCTNDLYVGDVGQGSLEEIDFEPANALAGGNYGWRLMEGESCFNPDTDCNPNADLILPVTSYGRNLGRSITGGFVYRASSIPALRGTYFYADYSSARFWSLRMQGGAAVEQQEITADLNPGNAVGDISSFGTNNAGEVFVTSLGGGTVYRIDAE